MCGIELTAAGHRTPLPGTAFVKRFGPPRPLHLALLFILLNHIPFTGMRLAISLYALHLGATPAVVGVIVALFSVLPMIGSVHLGRLIDRKGMRLPLLIAAGVLGFANLLAALWPSVHALFAVTALTGAAYITIFIAGQQLVGRYGGAAERVGNYSTLSTMFAVSLAAVPMLSGLLLDHIGFRATFLGMAVLPLVSMLLIAFDKLPMLGPMEHASATAGGEARTADALTASKTAGAMELVRNPELFRLYGFSILFTVSWDMFLFLTPIHGARLGLSASQIGVVVGMFSVAMFLVRMAGGHAAQQFTARQLLLLCLSGAGLGCLGFGLVESLPLLIGCAFAMGLGQGLANPTLNALLYDASPPERVGEAMGLRTSIGKACQVALPLAAGSASALFGVAPVFWLIATVQLGAAWMARAQWKVK